MLDRGEVPSAAAIAERSGLCAVYVRNILFLLRLHPAILKAIENGKHIVMVNVEADAVAGPLLALKARQAGVVYSLAWGDLDHL